MDLFKFLPQTDQQKFDQQGDEVACHAADSGQNGGFENLSGIGLHCEDQGHATEGANALRAVEIHHGCPLSFTAVWLSALATAPASAR